MKIVLINSSVPDALYVGLKIINMPPLNLPLIAALTPKDNEIRIVDEQVEKVDYGNLDADLVGITAMTSAAPRAYEIADIFRSRGIPVVMGGIHVSALPNEALEHATSVVIGEAENVWPKVVSDSKKGKLKRIYLGRRSSLNGLPYPKWDLIRGKYGSPYTPVQTSRGCPFRCDFCSVHKFFGGSYRTRPVDEVVNEIKEIKKDFIIFVDDNIVGNRNYAKELFRAITPLNLNWFGQASISFAKDEELLKLVADSGCDSLLIGFESVSQSSLDEMKKVNRVSEYPKLIKKIQDYGIEIWSSFVFGFDSDKKDVFKKTIDFCNANDILVGQSTILTPLPGTDLFNRLKKQNRILTYDWRYYDLAHCVFKPKNMSALELEGGLIWTYKEFYSFKSFMKLSKYIIKRFPKHKKGLKKTALILSSIPEVLYYGFFNWNVRKISKKRAAFFRSLEE